MKPIIHSSIHFEYILKTIGIIILLSTFILYAHYQARNLISGPSITLTQDPPTIQHEHTVRVAGLAKNITALTLNGKPIFTDEEGAFSQILVLENGYTIQTFRAEDRYGRSISLSRPYVYIPL